MDGDQVKTRLEDQWLQLQGGAKRAWATLPEPPLLRWAITFFVVAIITGVLGFGGIAGAAAEISRLLFFILIVMFVGSLVAHAVARPRSA